MDRNSANRVILVGHLGSEAEVRVLNSNVQTANLNIATNTAWKSGNGEYSEKTEWHRVTVWRNLAEYSKSLVKGQLLYIEGHLQNREWTDKEDRKHYITEVVADKITLLGPRKKFQAEQEETEKAESA